MFWYMIRIDGNTLKNTIPQDVLDEIQANNSSTDFVHYETNKHNLGITFASSNAEHIARKRIFRGICYILENILTDIYMNDFSINEITHNSSKIIGAIKQSIEVLIPPRESAEALNHLALQKIVAKEVAQDANTTANTILKIYKNAQIIESDFKAFSQLILGENGNISRHDIRAVLIKSCNPLFYEFEERKIKIKFPRSVFFEINYNIATFCFFNIFHNASKFAYSKSYIRTETSLANNRLGFFVRIEMKSGKIDDLTLEAINTKADNCFLNRFDEGGKGLILVKKFLKAAGGSFSVKSSSKNPSVSCFELFFPITTNQ